MSAEKKRIECSRRDVVLAARAGGAALSFGGRASRSVKIRVPPLLRLLPTVHARAEFDVRVEGLPSEGSFALIAKVAPVPGRLTGKMPAKIGTKIWNWRDPEWPVLNRAYGKDLEKRKKFAKYVILRAAIAQQTLSPLPWDSPLWKHELDVKLIADGLIPVVLRGFALGGPEAQCAADEVEFTVIDKADAKQTPLAVARTRLESGVPGLVRIPDEDTKANLFVKRLGGGKHAQNVFVRAGVLTRMQLIASTYRDLVQGLEDRRQESSPYRPVRPQLAVTEASTQWGGCRTITRRIDPVWRSIYASRPWRLAMSRMRTQPT